MIQASLIGGKGLKEETFIVEERRGLEDVPWVMGDTGGRTVLCLVRHGVTDWNAQGRMQGHTDIPLNEEGVQQAQAAAERLAAFRWDGIWSSDLQRARRTAELIAARTGLPVTLWDQLRERRLGELEGKPFHEVRSAYPTYLTGEVDVPGVEPRSALQERALRALHTVAQRHPGQRVVVVSHGAFINAVLTRVSGGRLGSGITRLFNTSFTLFLWNGEGWDVPVVNDWRHLQPAP